MLPQFAAILSSPGAEVWLRICRRAGGFSQRNLAG
jgi:hypothetical protein